MCNVDDIICDRSWDILKELWESAYTRFSYTKKGLPKSMDFSEVSEDISDQWYEDLWYFDVKTWTPQDDDRALPGTHYDNHLIDILEYNSYEIMSKMREYLEEKYKSYEDIKEGTDNEYGYITPKDDDDSILFTILLDGKPYQVRKN